MKTFVLTTFLFAFVSTSAVAQPYQIEMRKPVETSVGAQFSADANVELIARLTDRPNFAGSGCDASFDYVIGKATPAAATCEITTTARVAYTVTTSQSWIQVSPSSGTLSTTPTTLRISVNVSGKTAGTYTGTFTVSGPQLAASTSTITLNVLEDTPTSTTPVSITTAAALPGATRGALYSTALGATGGTPPYTWTVISGSLPTGVGLSSSGQVSGTPGGAGSFGFCAQVTDRASGSASRCFTLNVSAPAAPNLSINAVGTIAGSVGQRLGPIQMSVVGDTPPLQWSASALPPGITITEQGQLSGTPVQQGLFTASVVVVDGTGARQSASLIFNIGPAAANSGVCDMTFSYTPGKQAPAGQVCEISAPVETPFTVVTSDNWIRVSPASGNLGPTITKLMVSVSPENKAPGTYRGTFTITGPQLSSRTTNVILVVSQPEAISLSTPPVLPHADQTVAYSQTLIVVGGAPPYTWNVTPGSSLPSGLTLSSDRIIGTPSQTGTFVFSLTVTDSARNSVSFPFSVYVPAVSGNGFLGHIAAGSSFATGFYVFNSGNTPAGFAMRFYDNDGHGVELPFEQSSKTVVSDVLPAGAMRYYEAGSTNASLVTGWADISSDAGISIQAMFRNKASDGNYYEAAVPLSSGARRFQMPFDMTTFAPTGSQIYTGIAVANADASVPATITCIARDAAGTVIPNAISIPVLPPRGHWSGYQFPALTGQRGTIDCNSGTTVVPLGLRFLGDKAFSSLSVTMR